LPLLLPLVLLGVAVGLVCLPLNAIDAWVDGVLAHGFAAGLPLPQQLLPLLLVPLLIYLQQGPLSVGKGSGIPQAVVCIDEPEQSPQLLALKPLLARLGLWSLASFGLLPLGREGPVVFVGAALVWLLRPLWKRPLGEVGMSVLLAAAGGAGMAAGFNTPLVAVVFAAEDLLQRLSVPLIWSALPVVLPAALIAGIGGEPMNVYGLVPAAASELSQLQAGLILGVVGGLLGALFSCAVLFATARFAPLLLKRPLQVGLLLGAALAAMGLITSGRVYGDGSAVVADLISRGGNLPFGEALNVLFARLLGPVLALGVGIPGGLIDPALAIGAVAGNLLRPLFDSEGALLGITLGMAAGLSGTTQLPLFSTLFAMRLCGSQELLPGLLTSSAVAAVISRVTQPLAVYHGLTQLFVRSVDQRAPRR
jgi:H+/Cl- antiporter ClcA